MQGFLCSLFNTFLFVSGPFGRTRREPIHLAGFQEEGPRASSLHVAPGEHLPPASGRLLFDAAGNREGRQRLCAHLLQEYR